MNLDALFALLAQAQRLCGHADYVVIGSLSILGLADVTVIPKDMTMSIDADCYTLRDPPRIFDLRQRLGEGSDYHMAHGIYLDPVSPRLPTLPDGWEGRLIKVERKGLVAWFIEPHDAAVSKLARGEERDIRWVTAGAKATILSLPTVMHRMKFTTFLDEGEHQSALRSIDRVKSMV